MTLLLLGIALAAPPDLLDDPSSAAARRAAAEALLSSPEGVRSGIEGLVALRADPTEGAAARRSAVEALSDLPPIPGLASVYAALAPTDATGRMRALAAELALGDPKRRAEATAELDRLAEQPSAALLVGRIWLRAGEIDRAREALRAPGGAALLALIEASPDPIRALVDAGYPRAAVALTDDGTPEGARAAARLAAQAHLPVIAEGRWRALLDDAPQDREATIGLARSLADQARVGAARAALGDADPTLAAVLDARLVIAGAAKTPAPDDDIAAATEGFRTCPDEPRVAGAWGALRQAEGDAAGALGPLARALDGTPADAATVDRYVRAAIAVGRPELAIPRVRAALAAASSPADRHTFARQLAGLLVARAEAAQAAGETDAALAALTEATVLSPTDPAVRDALRLLHGGGPGGGGATGPPDERTGAASATEDAAAGRGSSAAAPELPPLAGPHGGADALLAAGRAEEALEAYRATVQRDPTDAWAILGQAGALVALGRTEAARAVLVAALPPDLPADQAEARARLHAESWRLDGERLRAEGADADAIGAYGRSLALRADPWALTAVSTLYLSHGQPELALTFAQAAVERAEDEAEPSRTLARAQEALGRYADARVTLERVAAATGQPADADALGALARRRTLAEAEALRIAGDAPGAIEHLTPLLADPDPDVWGALAAARLGAGDPAGAVDAGIRGIALATTAARDGGPDRSRWATSLALAAARPCGCSARLIPHLEALVTATGASPTSSPAAALADARFDAAVQDALRLATRPRATAAVAALERLAPRADEPGDDPDDLARVGDAWLAVGLPDRAAPALEASLAAREDPTVRLSLARARLAQGRHADAREALAAVRPTPTPPPTVAPLPVLPLPAGAPPPPAAAPAAVPALSTEQAAARAALADALDRAVAPSVDVTAGVVHRGGTAGTTELLAAVLPVRAALPPLGRATLDVAAIPTRLDDSVSVDTGVAASAGVALRLSTPLTAAARLGVSPVGFLGGPYATWTGSLAFTPRPGHALSLATGRSPVTDSLASWAGTVDPATGQTWGRLSRLWLQGEALGGGGSAWDEGLRVGGGWIEGIGVDPDPYVDLLGWAGKRITPLVRVGGLAYLEGYARREDAFEAGSGGTFTPPLFGLVQLRVDLDAPLGAGRVCAGVAGGGQVVVGDAQLGVDTGGVGGARLAAGWPLGPRWTVDLDTSVEATTGGWHRERALLDLRWGAPPPSTSDVALPGSTVPGAVLPAPPCLPRSP